MSRSCAWMLSPCLRHRVHGASVGGGGEGGMARACGVRVWLQTLLRLCLADAPRLEARLGGGAGTTAGSELAGLLLAAAMPHAGPPTGAL